MGAGSVLFYSKWENAKKRDSNGLFWVCRTVGKHLKTLQWYYGLGAKKEPCTYYKFDPHHNLSLSEDVL